MKLFLDTADVDEISKAHKTGLLSGVTTNPTLMRKCGFEPMDVYQEIIDMGVPDVSMEVVGSADEMLDQALMLHDKFGPACTCLLYTSPSPRDATLSRMPSSA